MRAIETKQDFQRKPKVMQYSRFCFKCALLGDYPDHHPKTNPLLEMLNNLTRHKIDDHNSECCVENDEQFKSLVAFLSASLIIKQESSPEKSSSNNLRTTPVSAHKQLEPAKNLTDKWTTDFPLMLNTSYHDLSYEHVRGVDVTDEGFIVKFSGLYFVYASIQFNCTLDVNVFNKTLYHYLDMTKKPTRSIHLLRSVHTICQGCMQSQDFAGIFYIESGAKIHMSVSAHGVVNYPAKSMYMGLAMLTNQRPLNHNRLKNKQKNSARSNPTVTTMTRMKFSSSLLHTK
ncbi:unnamed protein product [Lymnaea stagnalis]|uniref:THD domain-containing protein n=1 Tax=Lymnaea stagnalis TaxID=6523 RepID=A0AAV2HB61_LYMST